MAFIGYRISELAAALLCHMHAVPCNHRDFALSCTARELEVRVHETVGMGYEACRQWRPQVATTQRNRSYFRLPRPLKSPGGKFDNLLNCRSNNLAPSQ